MFWLTRSQPGADRLAVAFAKAHLPYLVAPVLRIEATGNEITPAALGRVPDILLCVSEHGVSFAPKSWMRLAPEVIAVGPQTAERFASFGRRTLEPGAHAAQSVEGLLEHPRLAANALKGCHVGLAVGVESDERLARVLIERGATVTNLEVYRRVAVTEMADDLRPITAIVVSSGDGFRAASRLWFAANKTPDVPVFAPSSRVAALGGELGLRKTIDCGGAGAAAVLAAIERWQQAE